MRKRKHNRTHPAIKEAAQIANADFNATLAELRRIGYSKQADLPLEFSEWMIESASIIYEVGRLENEK